MKTQLLTLLFLFSSWLSFSQAPAIQWQESYGGTNDEGVVAIQQTTDGGYIIAGNSKSNNGDVTGNQGSTDFWIVKTYPSGVIEWQKSLGGSSLDEVTSIQQTSPDGGYIVVGSTVSNDGDVTSWHPGYVGGTPVIDAWVVKLDPAGNIEWDKALGGSSVDAGQFISQTSDGGYIVACYTSSNDGDVSGWHPNNGNPPDAWIVKLDSTGAIEWQKCLGGTGSEAANSVQQVTGGYIIAGFTNSADGDVVGWHPPLSAGTTPMDYWVLKLDDSGTTILWQNCLGGSQSEEATNSQNTTDGGCIVTGFSYSDDGDVSAHQGTTQKLDLWVVKLDSSGIMEWEKSLGGTDNDGGGRIWQTTDGGYIAAAPSASFDGDVTANHGGYDIWTVKLNSSGAVIWEKSLGGTGGELGGPVQQTSDGGYIVGGHSNSSDGDVTGNQGSQDFWVVKLNPEPSSGDSACITWDLMSSDAVTSTVGNITGQPETIGIGSAAPFMSVFGYNNGQESWVGTSGWVAGPVDPARFVEFSASPAPGNDLTVTNISFDFSDYLSGTDFGIIGFVVEYSTDGWTSSTNVGGDTYSGTSVQSFSAPVSVTVNNGEIFSVKIFPYAIQNGLPGTPTLAIHKNVMICGETSSSGSDTGSICGSKFNDLNGNSIWDSEEPGLTGWGISLEGPDNLSATVTTDANGDYCFENLANGVYTVSEIQQTGWQQTFPSDPGYFSIEVLNGQLVPDINFGNEYTGSAEACVTWDLTASEAVTSTTGNITGQPEIISQGSSAPFMSIFGYNNGQQLWVGNTGWVAGPTDPARYIEFNVSPSSGNDMTVTSLSFEFSDFISGTDFGIIGFVMEYSTDGWTSAPTSLGGGIYSGTAVQSYTLPLAAAVSNGQTFSLRIFPYAIQNGIAMTPSFATHKNVTICGETSPATATGTGSICGSKFNDLNGNSIWDNDEPGIAGWQINLTPDDITVGPTITLTDTDGHYCFENVPAGYFYVSETQQPGWEQTFPTDPNYLVGLVEGGVYTDIDFGNKQIGTEPEEACVTHYLTEIPCGGLITGNVIADGCSMAMGNEPVIYVHGYDATYGQTIYMNGGWQTGSVSSNQYLAFNIKPSAGYDLTLTDISFDYTDLGLVGNTIEGEVAYVMDYGGGNQSAPTPLGSIITYPSGSVQAFNLSLNQLVQDGEIFSLHIYLWANQNEDELPFYPTHRNVMMCGLTSPTLAIETSDFLKASIYPNPSKGILYVHLPENQYEQAVIIIYDMLGKKILEVPATGEETTINIQGIQDGMYNIEITTENGTKVAKKLILNSE